MSASQDKRRGIGTPLSAISVDLLPTFAGFAAFLLFFLLAQAYNYNSFAIGTFDPDALSWQDKNDAVGASNKDPGKSKSSEDDPDKVKKALVPSNLSQFQLDEFAARTVWLCSNFLMLSAAFALLWQSVVVLRQQVPRECWVWVLIAVVPGLVLWLLKAMVRFAGEDLEIIGIAGLRANEISGLAPRSLLDDIENLFVLCIVFVFAFAVGSLSTKRDRDTVSIAQVAERARDTVGLLNICAVFLVLGVFHLWTQWNWPITFLTLAKDRAFMRLVTNSVALNVGSLFTVMLGAIYFTAHARIRSIAHQLAVRALEQHDRPRSEADVRETLARNGFEYSSLFDIPTLAKVLSPLIAAGPVAQFVEWVYAY